MMHFTDDRRRMLWIRSIRRGMKEMDVIMEGFAMSHLSDFSDSELDAYEALLSENDQSLFAWVMGQEPTPEVHRFMVEKISASL